MNDQLNSTLKKLGYGVQAADGTQMYMASINQGTVPSSRMAASQQPTANDTVTIGGIAFKFVASLGAAVAQVQVKIGADAAHSYANLVDAINGKTSTQGSTWAEASTAFAKTVLADLVSATVLRLRWATARGGLALPGVASSIALAASITGGAAAWTNDNLNTMGKSPGDCAQAIGIFAVTAAMVTALATGIFIELPFTPTVFSWGVLDANGGLRSTVTDRMAISGNALVLTSNGATHVAATDQLFYFANS